MNRRGARFGLLRLVLVAAIAVPVVIASGASPTNAALVGLTDFEIESNTTVDGAGRVDWTSKFDEGQVAVSNDSNFTGAAVVQSDVGSIQVDPDWLSNCPSSTLDSVFQLGTRIDDPSWVGDTRRQSVSDKDDICQSYFSYDVVPSGPRAGHIVAYIGFSRRVFQVDGDSIFHFILSKGPDPDVRVDGDVVVEAEWADFGGVLGIRVATWGDPGPTLGPFRDFGTDNSSVDSTTLGYFSELAMDLTELGLAPNAREVDAPESCHAFTFGRVVSRAGDSEDSSLRDDGQPARLDFNACGRLVIQKEITAAVPGDWQFPVTVTAPAGVVLDDPNPVLTVPEGGTVSDPAVTYDALPQAENGGYNVWEELTGDLGTRWRLDSILCVNDRGTESPDDDGPPTQITSPDDVFTILAHETVTCTITNSPVPAVINVDKDADGGTGTWPVVLSGPTPSVMTVSDDGTIDFTTPGTFATSGPTPAGVYALTERDGSGAFRVGGWSCAVVGGGPPTEVHGASIGITVEPGDVVNCTVTNTPVPPPEVVVTKSASPTSFQEPATAADRPIVYTVEVHNGGDEPFTIQNVTDAVGSDPAFDLDAAAVGDQGGTAGATIVANDCAGLVSEVVNPNGSDSCQFSVSYTDRNAGDEIDDVVTAAVVDAFGQTATASDHEIVTVDDIAPTVVVEKQNIAVDGTNEIVAPGGLATYSIQIGNPDTAVEPFTITSVVDTISTGSGFPPTVIDYFTAGGPVVTTDCIDEVGTVLAPDESVACQFQIDTRLIGAVDEGDLVTNRVDVDVVDDDGTTDHGFDDADRDVVGEPPQLVVDKTDHDVDILEAADDIAYDITITNISITEPLTITSITDAITFVPKGGTAESRGALVIDENGADVSGLDGVGLVSTDCDATIGEVLDPNGGSTACTITLHFTGNADDRYQDRVTVDAVDDDVPPAAASASNEADTPVVNVPPAITIVNTASTASVPETGGQVVYTLTVTNDSFVSGDPVTITELSDSAFGSFFPVDAVADGVVTDCRLLEDVVLTLPGDSRSCSITAIISGQAGDEHVDNATVAGIGEEGSHATADDEARVLFTDVTPEVRVTKAPDQLSVDETGELVTFTVAVENATPEPAIVDSLTDDVFGDLTTHPDSTCVAGAELEADDGVADSGDDTYTCTFKTLVAQLATELQHTDTVTVTIHDNDGNSREFSASAIITFNLVTPTVELTKQDEPAGNATVNEPGGDVPYTIAITNTSDEPVRITTLTDTATYESPAGVTEFDLISPTQPISDVDCSADLDDAIAPQQTVSCTFVATLSGNPQIVRDQVDVVVTDNDGQTAADLAVAQVPILDVRPEVSIVKTADPTVISPGDEVTYQVAITNLSTVEEVALLTLVDDRFGDLFSECEQFGMATTLAPGASTTCEFGRLLDEAPGSTHTNVVTVTAADDETLANLATALEFRDDSILPVSATSEASVLTVGPDLELTKDDAGFVATAGQQTPFTYTITVVNVGDGEVNLADTVTVVDDLPDAFEWVAPAPAGCTTNGKQLTCSLAAASLRPAGTASTIVATARLAPGADAGVYENRAYVTTPDDPVTTPPPCTDTDAIAADNNVACEPTDVIPPPPDVVVIKSASPTSFQEPATAADQPIVYTVEVQNHGAEPFTITDLTDAVGANPAFDLDAALVGDDAGTNGATIVANGCAVLIGEPVNANGSDGCQFSVSYTGRNAGDQIDDVVSVSVEDAFDRTGSASDHELVTVDGVAPSVVVDKQNVAVGGTAIVAPGGEATYSIEIRNPVSAVEPFTITSVVDTISTTGLGFAPTEIDYFTIGGPVVATDCVDFVTPEPLAPGGSRSCTFTIDTRLLGTGVVAEGDVITNRVDVDVVDDDGATDHGFDDADRDVVGEPPQLVVDKTDHGVDILEAEDDIAYDVTITNISVTEPLTITSITDAVTFVPAGGAPETRGVLVVDANGVNTAGLSVTLVDTDCDELINTVLEPDGGSTACTITLRLTGNADDRYEDRVTVDAVDDENAHATASNEADTPVVNVAPAISIDNHPNVDSVPETGGEVVYTLTITNASVVSRDPVTITELSDSVFGNFFIDGTPDGVIATDCDTLENHLLAPPGEPGDSVSCSFTAFVSGQAGDEHVDNVTVAGIGEEGSRATDDDDAHVRFTDVIPAFVVTKTADQPSVDESGELVTFTVTVENDTLELLTVDSLVDDVYGDLVDRANLSDSTCESGAVLDPDDGVVGTGPDTYTCTFTVLVAQLADELQHVDTVTVRAHDDDGNTRPASDEEIVTFALIPPTVELTKQDLPGGNATVDEPGGDVPFTITVTNTSDEPVTITTLTETIRYEDPVGETAYSLLSPTAPISDIECSQSLAASLAPDQTVTCAFVAALAGNPQIVSDRVDVVVTDNDGQTGADVAAAQVPILDVRPEVSIVKTAEPTVISPGEEVTYELVVTNLSTVEEVTVLTLVDDRFGDLLPTCEAFGMATTLAPSASTTCEFKRVLDEAPGSTHTNIVTVSAADDETLANLDAPPGSRDPSLVPVTATSQASVTTVGPDLELTKDDAAFVATAGQQTPFPYTITVVNVGEGEVNSADTVTVVDDLPDVFEWVAPAPPGCGINGQQLTCSIPASSVQPAGTKVVVVATARVKADAVAGNFDNRAYVTTADDAVTAPPPCTDTQAVAADNNVDCETTPVVSSIITDLAPECVNNAPYITYDITPFGFTPSGGATLTFYDLDGNLIESTHVADLTGRVLYPGAQVDAAGLATDWPGWKFENGQWVVDPSDAHLRDGLRVVIEVNPTSEGTVSYPAAGSACADPAQAPPTTLPPPIVPPTTAPPAVQPPGALPSTGSSSTVPFALAAFGLLAVGGLTLLLGRRRRTDH